MVGATASALVGVINPLLTKLSTLLERECDKIRGVWRGMAFLRDELSSMKTALEVVSDVEEPALQVKEWMRQVRELSYDMEDCISIFMYHLAQDGSHRGLIRRTLRRLKTIRARHRIAGQIAELKERSEEVCNRHKRFEHIIGPSSTTAVFIDPKLPALFEEAERLVGIEGPRDELIMGLLAEVDTYLAKQCKVISIVGFGGLGKTTLANQVHKRIKSQFDCTAFVSVSRNPNINKVLVDILLGVLDTSNATSGRQEHIKRIKKDLCLKTFENHEFISIIKDYLKTKRYFIVIDDIWSISAWETIQYALPENNCASRILTTTRITEVAKSCCFPHEENIYAMKTLSCDDSKKLFLKRIFGREEEFSPELQQVAHEILKKCGGLPLAITNIASLLAIRPISKQEWERVMNSIGSALEHDQRLEAVKRILFVSYCDLYPHLKVCLLYLSIYPEDFEIDRQSLIWMWIAEGFIVVQHGLSLEEVGEQYFNELVNRNLILPVDIDHRGRPRACRIHDIMLDLLISLSSEENFVTILHGQKLVPSTNKIRHLSLHGRGGKQRFHQGTISLSSVRSISVFGGFEHSLPLLDAEVLRVLDLKHWSNLNNSYINHIGSFFQLRYLSLTNISKISRQIGKLQLLQTLDLRGSKIRELPATVVQLRQLVRLLMDRGVKLPEGISNMQDIEELAVFDGSRNSPNVVLELGSLIKLKVLNIWWGRYDATTNEGRDIKCLVSSIGNLGEHSLRSLYIENWGGCSLDFLVDSWRPAPCHLQSFEMFGPFYLPRFPKWMPSLSKLTLLDINMEQVTGENLHVLKCLPALLQLDLYTKESPQETLVISSSGFRFLKKFRFYPSSGELGLMFLKNKTDGLSLMFEAGAMPNLQELEFGFAAHHTLSAYGVGFNFGIQHLTSLRHLRVWIHCRGATACELDAAEDAIRKSADHLHSHVTVRIHRFYQEEMVKDDKGSNSSKRVHDQSKNSSSNCTFNTPSPKP